MRNDVKRDDVLRILEGPAQARFVTALAQRGATDLAEVEPAVRRIVGEVRRNRDRAVRRYATRWDGLGKGEPLRVSEADLRDAWEKTDPELQDAIKQAAGNIRRYAEWQATPATNEWRREIQPGVSVGQLVRPLESVGCYVPGGRYPLPSTLLMTVIPAQVAGVGQIRVASPRPAQATLAAAAFLGVREFYRVGGAQAIAALAYGTEDIPRVDKIVGPGNRYVTAAKKLVAFDCAIEFLAGPTETVVISEDGDSACIASDLVAQGEHDPDALCIFITSSRALAKKVQKEVRQRTRTNPIATQSLSRSRRHWRRRCSTRARFSWTSSHLRPRGITSLDRTTCCPRLGWPACVAASARSISSVSLPASKCPAQESAESRRRALRWPMPKG
jgi:histidinol dehydrogenase